MKNLQNHRYEIHTYSYCIKTWELFVSAWKYGGWSGKAEKQKRKWGNIAEQICHHNLVK